MTRKPKPKAAPTVPHAFRGADKRSAVLRAAMTLFLRDGYSGTSVDAVTAEAGVSKATVYAHFGGKLALFEALVREGTAEGFAGFPALARSSGDPAAELEAFFAGVLRHVMDDRAYAWDRMVLAEAERHPDLARLFQECVVDRLTAKVRGYLAALAAEGTLRPADVDPAADLLVAAGLLAPLHSVLLLGPAGVSPVRSIRFTIKVILRGVCR